MPTHTAPIEHTPAPVTTKLIKVAIALRRDLVVVEQRRCVTFDLLTEKAVECQELHLSLNQLVAVVKRLRTEAALKQREAAGVQEDARRLRAQLEEMAAAHAAEVAALRRELALRPQADGAAAEAPAAASACQGGSDSDHTSPSSSPGSSCSSPSSAGSDYTQALSEQHEQQQPEIEAAATPAATDEQHQPIQPEATEGLLEETHAAASRELISLASHMLQRLIVTGGSDGSDAAGRSGDVPAQEWWGSVGGAGEDGCGGGEAEANLNPQPFEQQQQQQHQMEQQPAQRRPQRLPATGPAVNSRSRLGASS